MTPTQIFGADAQKVKGKIIFPAGYYAQWDNGSSINLNYQGNSKKGNFVYYHNQWKENSFNCNHDKRSGSWMIK